MSSRVSMRAISRAARSAPNGASRAPPSTASFKDKQMMVLVATRRRLLAGAALVAFALALPAAAQDPRQNEAVAAARDWLVLLDKHDIKKMYATSGKRFREGISEEKWSAVAESGRE